MDAFGRNVLKTETNGQVDVSSLKSGRYFINVANGQKQTTEAFFKE